MVRPRKFRILLVTSLVALLAERPLDARPPVSAPRSASALKEYVNRSDSSFAWKVRKQGSLGTGEYAELILTSQTWRNIEWKHQLFVYRPAIVDASSQALLVIDGGSWSDALEAPPGNGESLPKEAKGFAMLADVLQTPVAIVRQVPEQPLFGGRKEDQIIALTFTKFLDTGEWDWPLLLPMTKAAVRAMDATQEFAQKQWQLDIEQFTVTGGSKRGWTTWLTAAVDPRVNALAPMVINMLNMEAHDRLQRETFGGYSEEIGDYTKERLHERLFTDEGAALRTIVDPYAYREQLLQPKLIILATNDAYWPVDALNLYWDSLMGDKYILYVPNNGHSIKDYPRVAGAIAALQRSLTAGTPLPRLHWQLREQPARVQLKLTSDIAPTTVRQWTAASATRDFRHAQWTAADVPRSATGQQFVAELPSPQNGYNAMFLEAEFPGDPLPFHLSTTLHVFAADRSAESGGGSASQ